MKNALQMVHDFRGIAKVKAAFRDREEGKLEEFRQSLRELGDSHINPVKIPEEWGIDHIPNLSDGSFRDNIRVSVIVCRVSVLIYEKNGKK